MSVSKTDAFPLGYTPYYSIPPQLQTGVDILFISTIVYVYIDGYSLLAYEVDFFLDKLFLDFYMHQRILRQVNMQMYTS